MGHFGNIRVLNLSHGDYCSPTVTKIRDDIGEQIQAAYVTSVNLLGSLC
jgi:hypothetical protein